MPELFARSTGQRPLVVPVLLIAGAACLAACSSAKPSSIPPRQSSTLTIGFPFPTGQDQLRGLTEASRLISLEGLTTQNLNGRSIPRLAEAWSQSSDGLTWTINLRRSARFHDGSPVDAAAVKGALERYMKSRGGRSSLGLQDVVSIDASNPFTLTVRLRQRSTLFLDDLDSAAITRVDSSGNALGTGPYMVTSSSANEIVMSSFPQYYRGVSAVDKLIWRQYPTVRTAWASMMRGELDFLYEVGPESREFLESERTVALYSFLRNYVYGVVFNSKHPILLNPEVRRAMNYAVDRKAIVESGFRGHATAANGPAWPLHWAYEPSASSYTYDPARAAASLGKAVGPGTAGIPATKAPLRFSCMFPENYQLWERLALMVQRDLSEIGIELVLEAVPVEEFSRRVEKGDFDLVLIEMISGFSGSRPFSFWHSAGVHNFSSYRNASVDEALEIIKRASGDADYRKGFHQFQQATFDDPPAIFLAWGETARAVSRRFDVVRAPSGDIRMTISDWQLAGQMPQAVN